MDKRLCVLTVAGLDSTTGAGITADVDAITAIGMRAAVVCTAVTAQTAAGVRDIHTVPASSVAAQLNACFDECDVRAIKTGMLVSRDIVRTLAHCLREKLAVLKESGACPLVVDPVMSATAGGQLLSDEGIAALMEELLPLAFVVTPNLPEAARLAGMPVENVVQMKDAAARIRGLGVKNVIITGGHLPDKALDVLYDGSKFVEFPGRKLPAKVHGTGCTYSAALATYLALGMPLEKAAAGAKQITARRIEEEGL
jgi:hydroxymethylpyrimidine kinase/phosphomethylpyrimidine kinase